jgi:SAM-dependent methyltransferase
MKSLKTTKRQAKRPNKPGGSQTARIPKILHYTFGLAADFGGQPWSLVHHVCLRSAIERIKPEQVFFYYEYEPSGPWWALSRSLVTPIKITAPREIFGRPLTHVAHRSDVVRLQKLIEHGGIYLDSDVFVQRSFDQLLDFSTVLGSEGEGAEVGLANAVILAEPNAPFLQRWLETYRSFRGNGRNEYWNEHSVRLPAVLAKAHPSEITVLSHDAFFWPLCKEEHLQWIFNSKKPIPLLATFANHLWESHSWKFLANLTPRQVRRKDANFHLWARPLVAGLADDYGAPSLQDRISHFKWRLADQLGTAKSQTRQIAAALVRKASRLVLNERNRRRKTFQDIYQRELWGTDGESKFFSGVDSSGPAAEFYVYYMAELLEHHSRELGRPLRVVDLGCGDFRVGGALVDRMPDLTYIGCDIVPELVAHNAANYANERVRFQQLDAVCDPLPEGDVCLIRQVFQHLSNAYIQAILQRLPYQVVYVSEGQPAECAGPVNPDKVCGAGLRFDWSTGRGRGVELQQPPYCLSTQEVFRCPVPPNEVMITERVDVPSGAARDELAHSAATG